jgi:hypothetical protein
MGGVIETATRRKRKEAVVAQLKDGAQKAARTILHFDRPPIFSPQMRIVKTTAKSVLLRNERKAERIEPEQQNAVAESSDPLIILFGPVEPVPVVEAEEQERLTVARAREVEALMAGMNDCVNLLVRRGHCASRSCGAIRL